MLGPGDDDHEHMLAWTGGGLRPFDLDRATTRVHNTLGVVPASVRLLLDLVGGGVGGGTKLTPGGRLPRAIVRAVQAERPGWYPLGRPASIEEDLLPLVVLHDLLRTVGLLRLSRGVLAPTRAAGNDVEIVRRLRARFDPESFETRLTEVTVGQLIAIGEPIQRQKLAEQVLPLVGSGWSIGGRPITVRDIDESLVRARHEWAGLDLITTDRQAWAPGPSARSLLPGATTLGDYWTPR